jgi:Domain of unknown function (DUF4381)
MNRSQSPLDQLADIHLPAAPGYWPLALGWWMLIALSILLLIALFFWWRSVQKNRYRKLALKELEKIHAEFNRTQNTIIYLAGINELLKRTALTAYPKQFSASIKGTEWVMWLDSACPTTHHQFTQEFSDALTIAHYQKNPQVDADKLKALCTTWILKHRNPLKKDKDSTYV